MIQRVLDHVLNTAPSEGSILGGMDWDLPGAQMDLFNFDFMDTYDWLRPGINI